MAAVDSHLVAGLVVVAERPRYGNCLIVGVVEAADQAVAVEGACTDRSLVVVEELVAAGQRLGNLEPSFDGQQVRYDLVHQTVVVVVVVRWSVVDTFVRAQLGLED